MARPKTVIHDDYIIEMYRRGVTTPCIASKIGFSSAFVRSRLRDNGVKLTRGVRKKELKVSTKRLIEMYVTERMSLREIAKQFDINYMVIRDRLLEANVQLRGHNYTTTSTETELDICREYLKCRSAVAVGKKFKLSHVIILQIVRAYGIATSSQYKQNCTRCINGTRNSALGK